MKRRLGKVMDFLFTPRQICEGRYTDYSRVIFIVLLLLGAWRLG